VAQALHHRLITLRRLVLAAAVVVRRAVRQVQVALVAAAQVHLHQRQQHLRQRIRAAAAAVVAIQAARQQRLVLAVLASSS
jgi:hypothetical protein